MKVLTIGAAGAYARLVVPAAEGMDGVFHLNPAFAPDEADMGVAMVEAAEAVEVPRFVFSSVYHPSISLVNHASKRRVEEALYASDMQFTVLQPAMFMQNLQGSWSAVRETGRITRPYSKLTKVITTCRKTNRGWTVPICPMPIDGFLEALFLTVRSVARSRAFYSEVLGAQVVLEENPCTVKLADRGSI